MQTITLINQKGRVGKSTFKRFKKYFPDEFRRLHFIIPDKYARDKANGEMVAFLMDDLGVGFRDIESYKEMEKFRGIIPEWE